ALLSRFAELGGVAETGHLVKDLGEVPPAPVILLDLTPRQVLGVWRVRRAPAARVRAQAPRVPVRSWRLQARLGAVRSRAVARLSGWRRRDRAPGRDARRDRQRRVGSPRRPPPRTAVRAGGAAVRSRRVPGPRRQARALGVLPRAERVSQGHDRRDRAT